DLTSPRRSSRNHASTLALDVAMSVTSSLHDGEEGEGGEEDKIEKIVVEKRKNPRDSSASSSTSRRSKRGGGDGAMKTEVKGKRKAGRPPGSGVDKRRRKRSETEDEVSSEEEEGEVKKEEGEGKRVSGGSNDFSVSRLIGGEKGDKRLDKPDDDALPISTDVLFGDDALGRVDLSQYPPNCTQFNIGGTKYLPLSCLMDDEGFTVSINDTVSYLTTAGKKRSASLSDALRNSGLSVKRRVLGKDLLHMLRIAGLVVHWAFVGQLDPALLKKLQADRDKARKAHNTMLQQYEKLKAQEAGLASEEVVKQTVAELIQERKRRSGLLNGGKNESGLLSDITFKNSPATPVPPSPPLATPSLSQSIFPVRDYRSRSVGLEALARAAALRRENMTVAELMMQQMQLQQQLSGRREAYEHPPGTAGNHLKISDPDHLTKFIGLLNGDKDESPTPNPSTSNSFADFDHVPSLSITEKILLISDFDGGATEQQLAEKYKVAVDKVPGIIRLRVPLIREQTRIFMERRVSKIRALPVRRTNFVGLNIMMWRFFKDCRDRGIALTGRQLKEHAMTIASQLGLSNFKGSEGWLDAFKRRHKIDLRTMTGEAVNYESDPDGNIVCTSADGADDDECSYDEAPSSILRDSSSSPLVGGGASDNPTDQLLASVTAFVNKESPVVLPPAIEGGEKSGSDGLHGFQANYDDPRMAADYRLDEASLITNIIRSTAVYVPNQEVAHALDVLRSYIVTHDPSAIGFFVDLQTRLASTIGAQQMVENCAALAEGADFSAGSSGLSSVGLLNGVGGMSDSADQKTPPMVNGEANEENMDTSSGDAIEEKENEEGEKSEAVVVPCENGTANSSHDSTTSEDSNDD
ncbi:hypothetical protein PFISCL1PPCAC_8438, partial [Pristionchus fissidentatus]